MLVLSLDECRSSLVCLRYILGCPCSSAVLCSCPCGSRSACLWFHWVPLGPCEFSPAPFGALLGLNKFFDFLKGEVILEVVFGGLFFHHVFGYGGVFQSLHQGVHCHLVNVRGLANW